MLKFQRNLASRNQETENEFSDSAETASVFVPASIPNSFPASNSGSGANSGLTFHANCSMRQDGDRANPQYQVGKQYQVGRQKSLPRVWLQQQHGDKVVVADDLKNLPAGALADACVSMLWGVSLVVTVADCIPLGFWTDSGKTAVAHAGWRGLASGVVERTVDALRCLTDPTTNRTTNPSDLASDPVTNPSRSTIDPTGGSVKAVIGPHICSACYEFSPGDAAPLQEKWGADVLLSDATGQTLDLRLILMRCLASLEIEDVSYMGGCTACEAENWFSYRARGEAERMEFAVWVDQAS